ncbi:MAG: energy transducer TonB, partial [Stellaceae bacterium]
APPPPPPPPPVVVKPPPPAPASVSEPPPPPPPPPKPAVPPLPERVPRRIEPQMEPRQPYLPYTPPATPATRAPPAPARAPSTAISPGYRALLSEWLEAHKRYPETARAQGEQGQAILRFVVERGGRVAQYAIVKSTGYPDLDAALDDMMRGATLPPFPPGMDEVSITVSVAIRFSLGE